ncbi:DUF721 domain-containing protein [Cerasicoccus maritimus]|uniref:DUF721 domain-containing protein n=1 Tax=Cerasicoccus maritimus TaxID=490089 RepID=UPI00285288FC|nr:DUF721 domain-containing protein [Cerasicoccus maritimus]
MHFNREVNNLIANLRGVPEDRGRSVSRQAKPIDSLVEVIIERYKIGKPTAEEIIVKNWKDIVGEKTAHRARPMKIVNGKQLVILASNSVIKQELLFTERQILKRIRALPECGAIRDVKITG